MGLAACGSDDDTEGSDAAEAEADSANADDDSAAESGATNGGDSDGSAGASSSDGSADAAGGDFPIPAPDGLVLDALADSGIESTGQRQLYYENDDLERVTAFYDDWTGQNGEWAKTEAEGFVTFIGLDGGGTISITPEHDPGAQADGPVTFVLLIAGS
ncbi:MAG: hypothetical protein ACR2O6_07245 [Ilumatobacteraceae bacterium]